MSKFSSGLILSDLNDFISPSQSCIKPVESPIKNSIDNHSKDKNTSNKIQYDDIQLDIQSTPVTISLNDCLACSGCITSAESVLIQLQSHKDLLDLVNQRKSRNSSKKIIISISPQSIASIQNKYNLSYHDTISHLNWLFYSLLQVDILLDITVSRDISLMALSHEFENKKGTLLASACPGWICYAEKTHADLLPLISRVKSPQQIQGSLVKSPWFLSTLFPGENITPDLVYHLSIMPCYDKKLEASRSDFSHNDIRDVDCVITTGEVETLWKEFGLDLGFGRISTGFGKLDEIPSHVKPMVEMFGKNHGSYGSSSGGYLHQLISYILSKHSIHLPPSIIVSMVESLENGTSPSSIQITEDVKLELKQGKNSDIKEWIISTPSSTLFKGAQAYGFRNIQNLVRKLSKKPSLRKTTAQIEKVKDDYDFVEVMACPSGCINGGGQLRPTSGTWSSVTKEWITSTESSYRKQFWNGDEDMSKAEFVWKQVIEGREHVMVLTEYHAVEKSEWDQSQALTVKW